MNVTRAVEESPATAAGCVRVLHVLGSLGRGGVETRLVEMLHHVDRSRIAFDFCLLGSEEGVCAAEARSLGARVLNCPLRPATGTFPARLVRLVRRGTYDVVHSHVHQFSGIVLLAAWLAGVPGRCALLHSVNDGRTSSLRRKTYRKMARLLLKCTATEIAGVSEAVLMAFFGSVWRTEPRLRVIYLGPDTSRFGARPLSSEERLQRVAERGGPVIVHVARFVKAKNHRSLMPIAHEVLRTWRGARFLLVGDGPEAPAIKSSVLQAGLADAFQFLGDRRDVPEILASSDVLILPSLWEGLGGVVLEALAVGVPVVGSPLAAVEEIARHNTGVVLADPSKPAAFAAAIGAALALDEIRLAPQFTATAAEEALTLLYRSYRRTPS